MERDEELARAVAEAVRALNQAIAEAVRAGLTVEADVVTQVYVAMASRPEVWARVSRLITVTDRIEPPRRIK